LRHKQIPRKFAGRQESWFGNPLIVGSSPAGPTPEAVFKINWPLVAAELSALSAT
jgi:hypothetical protein